MSSGFITETEIAEQRKKRQEEWEKVRNPDEPLERPEESYDSRSLYDRLKEQKMKKDLEYEEAHKLKNLIRGLDDDEVEFLDYVDRTKMKVEKQQQIEERKELEEFRKKVALLQEQQQGTNDYLVTQKTKVLNNTVKNLSTSSSLLRQSQQKSILSGIVRKRKINNDENNPSSSSPPIKKIHQEPEDNIKQHKNKLEIEKSHEIIKDDHGKDPTQNKEDDEKYCSLNAKDNNGKNQNNINPDPIFTTTQTRINSSMDKGALKCIGILPGIGFQTDSDQDSDFESDEYPKMCAFDLVGRKIQRINNHEDD